MPMRDTASAQPFLSPAERRQHAKEVNAIVKRAAQGKYPEALWPLAASVGFGPEDLKRLPVEVAAGVAEAQERLKAKPRRVGRDLAALIDLCGIETLLREDPRDLMVCLGTAAARSAALFLARSNRCNEAAMVEQVTYGSATVTAVEAQRAGNTGMRLMQASAQMEQIRQKMDIEAGKAAHAGFLPPEARQDEAWRGRRISERVERDRQRERYQKKRDEHELAMALEAAAQDRAARQAQAAASGAETEDCRATPSAVSSGDSVWSERRHPAGSFGVEDTMMPARGRRSDQEGTDGPNRGATPCAVSGITAADGGETIAAGEVAEPVAVAGPDVIADAPTIPVGYRQAPMPLVAPSLPVQPPRRGRRAMAAARAAALAAGRAAVASTAGATRPASTESTEEAGQAANGDATPCTVSGNVAEAAGPLAWDSWAVSATAEPLVPVAMLPLPLPDRRAAASDALRELEGPAAKDDPANGWEVEMLGIAVKTGRASASIVARFVEEAGSVDIFPEPGSTEGRRPSFPEFLGRLAPRGSPRVTATASCSISLAT